MNKEEKSENSYKLCPPPPPTKSNETIGFREMHHVPIVLISNSEKLDLASDCKYLHPCTKGSFNSPMSYKSFTNDSKRGSPVSLEFSDDEKTAPLSSGILLRPMADNNFEGGPSLVSSGSSM